jgi:hypothetical protein
MKLLKIIFAIFAPVLLIYMVLPGPDAITDFSDLPNSTKSTYPGDTVQVPHVAGYFSANYRRVVIPFYIDQYQKLLGVNLPPIRLIYPPEYAYTAIKDQTQSTYLEELSYPLRDSLFINGMEPFEEGSLTKRFTSAIPHTYEGIDYQTKVVVRYYPSSVLIRIIVWIGIVSSIIMLSKTTKRVIYSNE